jgi:aminopeptidase N
MPRRISAILAGFLIGGLAFSSDTARIDERPRPPRPDPYLFDEHIPRGFDVAAYGLELAIDPISTTLTATATIILTITEPAGLDTLWLDFVGFEITRVTVDDVERPFRRSEDDPELAIDELRVLSGRLEPNSRHRVLIAYRGQPSLRRNNWGRYDILLGFQGFGEEDNVDFNRTRFTQSQMEGTRLWMPCVDHPSDKATWRATIAVPDPLVAVSNGALEAGSPTTFLGDGGQLYRRYTYVEQHEIANYLIAVMIGRFALEDYQVTWRTPSGEDRSVQVRNHYPPEFDREGARQHLAKADEALPIFDGLLGPYPFDHYGHVVVTDGEVQSGMEHQTITLVSGHLFQHAHHELLQRLVIHELAHSWMGNLVTPKDYQSFWINEGFATLAEYVFLERSGQGLAARIRLLQAWNAGRKQYWDFYKNDPTLAYPYRREILGPGAYFKGAWVYSTLRVLLGDDTFFQGIRALLAANAGKSIGVDELRAAMEGAAARDLSWFFDQYVFGFGFPIIRYGCRARDVAVFGKAQVDCTFQQLQTDYNRVADYWISIGVSFPAVAYPNFRAPIPIWFNDRPEVPQLGARASIRVVELEPVEKQTISICLDEVPAWIGADPLGETYAILEHGLEVEETDYVCTR